MKLLRFELKKVFGNKFFIGMLIFAVFLNLFTLYETNKGAENAVSASEYSTYDEFLASVQKSAEASLSASVFSENLSEFSRRNIEKTAEDFEKMQGIEITPDTDTGIRILLDSKVSDFCILMILISLGLSLIVDEKEKRLFHLLRSTKFGTLRTISAKLTALLICSLLANLAISLSSAGYAFSAFGFGDLSRSIQSVPEMLTAFLRLNLGEFLLMIFIVKTLGIFTVGIIVLFCCLFFKRSITMLLAVGALSALSAAMTFIPETSALNHFRYINLCSLINPYSIFRAYLNLNIFGKPVNVILVFAVFASVTAVLSLSVTILYYLKKRPLENSDKRTRHAFFKGRTHSSIAYFELKKLLILNKGAIIILLFAALQIYSVSTAVNYQSSEDYQYKYYMKMLGGNLTEEKEAFILTEKAEIDEAQEKLQHLNEQRQASEITLQEFIGQHEECSKILEKAPVFSRVYDKYLYIKENPKAEFFYDLGYEKLFGISEPKFSLASSVKMLSALTLCLCSVYSAEFKNSAYRILITTKHGASKLRKAKNRAMTVLSLLVFCLSYCPEIIYIGRFYGFKNLGTALTSIPELSYFGALPIWSCILIMYLLRFAVTAMLLPIISALSLKSKNNILTATIFFILFPLPLILYGTGLDFMRDFGIFPLLSGTILIGDNIAVIILQAVILLICALAANRFLQKSRV